MTHVKEGLVETFNFSEPAQILLDIDFDAGKGSFYFAGFYVFNVTVSKNPSGDGWILREAPATIDGVVELNSGSVGISDSYTIDPAGVGVIAQEPTLSEMYIGESKRSLRFKDGTTWAMLDQ